MKVTLVERVAIDIFREVDISREEYIKRVSEESDKYGEIDTYNIIEEMMYDYGCKTYHLNVSDGDKHEFIDQDFDYMGGYIMMGDTAIAYHINDNYTYQELFDIKDIEQHIGSPLQAFRDDKLNTILK